MMNKEGYPDPTAERAVHNASRIPKHIRSIYRMLNAAAGVSGLEIIGLRDKEQEENTGGDPDGAKRSPGPVL